MRDSTHGDIVMYVCFTVCWIALVASIAWGTDRSNERTRAERIACIERGGSWADVDHSTYIDSDGRKHENSEWACAQESDR